MSTCSGGADVTLCDRGVCTCLYLGRVQAALGNPALGDLLGTHQPKGRWLYHEYRDLSVTHKMAWFMLHRIQEPLVGMMEDAFGDPMEIGETHIGGKESNKHVDKKLIAGRGTIGKTSVVGIKDRATGRVRAEVVPDTTKNTLQGFVNETVSEEAPLFKCEHKRCQGLSTHLGANHNPGDWVRPTDTNDLAHTNGKDSYWPIFSRAFRGTYHKTYNRVFKQLRPAYTGKHYVLDFESIDRLSHVTAVMAGRRLMFKALCGKRYWDALISKN